jgi:hypothetical protein
MTEEQRKTLKAVFADPVRANLASTDPTAKAGGLKPQGFKHVEQAQGL